MFRYKGRNLPPQMIGQDLGVRAVLTGTLAQRGDALVMQVDLVDAVDGAQLWGEQFNRQSAELFVMQDELAQRILDKLRAAPDGRGEEEGHQAPHPERAGLPALHEGPLLLEPPHA